MVKNQHGGNKHKGMARKHVVETKRISRLRVAEYDGEIYSIATKMLGNNMFHCVGVDNITRLCHIRGKFSGRGKRDNIINAGTWILIGIREWDNNKKDEKKIPHCDLLEVYSDFDKQRLKDSVSERWEILIANDMTETIGGKIDSSYIEFITEEEEERNNLEQLSKSKSGSKISLKKEEREDKIGFVSDDFIDDI